MSNNNVPGSNQNVNVQVRTLTTDPNVTSQYKTKILHKNVVNGVNTLTQSMMNDINTKYVVKYDYVLGEDITVPENCIFEFDGGSISGAYTLNLNNCYIRGYKDLFACTISGSISNEYIFAEWIIGTDNDKLQKSIALSNSTHERISELSGTGYLQAFVPVVLEGRIYNISSTINSVGDNFYLYGNNATINFNGSGNIFNITSLKVYIEHLNVYANDKCAFYLNIGNLDGSMVVIKNVDFWTKNTSIDNYAIYLNSQSAVCSIMDCNVVRAPHFLHIYNCDKVNVERCWINGYADNGKMPDNTCCIKESHSVNISIKSCILVPEWDGVGVSANTRWFDTNSANWYLEDMNIGGENAGLPIFYKFANGGDITVNGGRIPSGLTNSRADSGFVVLYNEDIYKVGISLTGVKQSERTEAEYQIINPYWTIKNNLSSYATNKEAKQAACNLFEDYIKNNYLSLSPIFISKGTPIDDRINYMIMPFVNSSNRALINNINMGTMDEDTFYIGLVRWGCAGNPRCSFSFILDVDIQAISGIISTIVRKSFYGYGSGQSIYQNVGFSDMDTLNPSNLALTVTPSFSKIQEGNNSYYKIMLYIKNNSDRGFICIGYRIRDIQICMNSPEISNVDCVVYPNKATLHNVY